MAIVQDLRKELLGMIGILDPEDADEQTLEEVLYCINSALQKLREYGDDIWGEEETGETIRDPATISNLTLTRGAKSLTGNGLEAWMHGCTVVLDGDSLQNRILQTGAATYALAKPYTGQSAVGVGGTVYCDAVNCEPFVLDVRPPVILAGNGELACADGFIDLAMGIGNFTDHGRKRSYKPWPLDLKKCVNSPEMYRVEVSNQYDGSTVTRIVFDTLPPGLARLDFRTRRLAARVASLDSTVAYLIPHNYKESVLQPFCRYEFATTSQAYAGNLDNELTKYQSALEVLSSLANKNVRPTICKPSVF